MMEMTNKQMYLRWQCVRYSIFFYFLDEWYAMTEWDTNNRNLLKLILWQSRSLRWKTKSKVNEKKGQQADTDKIKTNRFEIRFLA